MAHTDLDQLPQPPLFPLGRADYVFRDVQAARMAWQDNPPTIQAALAHCARARDMDDEEMLDCGYRELAVAAMSNLSKLRAAYPELIKP